MSFRFLGRSVFAFPPRPLAMTLAATALILASAASAQEPTASDSESTVTYPAEFFAPYEPNSVNDMLNRIPGISSVMSSGHGGGPGSSGGANRRGLGAGGDQILINGRRMAGKENEGTSQLSRIPASQVQYIEIIRGTSGDLDVRGGGQVVNIVLLAEQSRSSVAAEVNMDRYHDGTLGPGGSISLNGQRGAFNYLFSLESEPRYEFRDGFETSILADGTPNDIVTRKEYREQDSYTLSSSMGYDLTPRDRAHFNFQMKQENPPGTAKRVITDLRSTPNKVTQEYDTIPATASAWEIGGDYEHTFANNGRVKTLFIVNNAENESTRDAYRANSTGYNKFLYLANQSVQKERIVRSSYSFNLNDTQALEVGIERAQTILDAQLQLGLPSSTKPSSPLFGGLAKSSNTDALVEEIRYESFVVHNWTINDRMTLESTLLYETSTIEQTGDVHNKRDFAFLRPKVDYRFNITPSVQLRASIEKDVSQLSFGDFTSSVAGGDDDQNALAGNPQLAQEKSVRYEVNLEYRLPSDGGVLSTKVFYHDLTDVIDKINVSTATTVQSANGNIGSGERYGVNLDASIRLGFIGRPEMLLTSGVQLEDSNVTDSFLGTERRLRQAGRGSFRLGFRHDVTAMSLNYGFNYNHGFTGNRKAYDIDKIEDYESGDFLVAFVEKVGFMGLTYRFDVMNLLEGERCRIRSRYVGGTIATGYLNEIEDSCSNTGAKYAIKIRGTF